MPGTISPDGSSHSSEPPMYLQRPSSARSQDVSHVLSRTFRQLFMRDAVGSDTVHYLTKSRGGDDAYHERYVAALEKVTSSIIYLFKVLQWVSIQTLHVWEIITRNGQNLH